MLVTFLIAYVVGLVLAALFATREWGSNIVAKPTYRFAIVASTVDVLAYGYCLYRLAKTPDLINKHSVGITLLVVGALIGLGVQVLIAIDVMLPWSTSSTTMSIPEAIDNVLINACFAVAPILGRACIPVPNEVIGVDVQPPTPPAQGPQ